MSESKLGWLAGMAGAVVFSCSPYQEPVVPQQPAPGPAPGPAADGSTVSAEQQQQIKEERERAAAEAQRKIDAEEGRTPATPGGATTTQPPSPSQETPRRDFEFATPVPGKPGFVFSPYNNKMIDVRDIPSGTLVQDPTYPASEKKYFRVP